jgi:hypothetical protein
MKKILLATACAIAFGATTPALADLSGTLSGDYLGLRGQHWNEDHFRLTGVGAIPLDWNDISLQGSAQYEYAADHHFDWSEGTFAATAFWTGDDARVALNFQRTQVLTFSTWNSGVGAEYFLAPDWTIAAKGGAWWGTERTAGGYFGGQLTYYWDPDFSLSATGDYSKVPNGFDTEIEGRAEYLVWDQISIYGAYTYVDDSHDPVNLFLIGLKFYCDGDGATTLVGHHRQGPVGYISTFEPLWFHD